MEMKNIIEYLKENNFIFLIHKNGDIFVSDGIDPINAHISTSIIRNTERHLEHILHQIETNLDVFKDAQTKELRLEMLGYSIRDLKEAYFLVNVDKNILADTPLELFNRLK